MFSKKLYSISKTVESISTFLISLTVLLLPKQFAICPGNPLMANLKECKMNKILLTRSFPDVVLFRFSYNVAKNFWQSAAATAYGRRM